MAWGCTQPQAPAIALDLNGGAPSNDVSSLAAVLSAAVNSEGDLRPEELAQCQTGLQRQLQIFAVTGPSVTPELFASSEQRVAYWYNARVAWSLELARRCGQDARIDPALWLHTTFPVDGRRMSLEQIDEHLLQVSRKEKDFHIAACAPGAWIDDAPLPGKPFIAADLPARQQETLNRLVLNEERFVIDIDRQSVYVPRMLWRVRDVLMEEYARQYGPGGNVLVALKSWVAAFACARLEDAVGYRILEQSPRPRLAIEGRKMYLPGKIGRVEIR